MHNRMFQAILHAPMTFFDTNPSGRIINRFSKDQATLDNDTTVTITNFYTHVLSLGAVLVTIIIVSPLFIIVVIPIAIMYWITQGYYRNTSRECRRLESISRSPLFSFFTACISGAPTIRACSMQPHMDATLARLADFSAKHTYIRFILNRHLGVRLETMGNVLVLASSLFGILSRAYLNSSYIAFSITNSLAISTILTFFIRLLVDAETNLTSCERIMTYCDLPQETSGTVVPEDWPSNGEIEFGNYSVKYRDDLPFVLHDLNVDIQGKQKIGVVGRTGSGKVY